MLIAEIDLTVSYCDDGDDDDLNRSNVHQNCLFDRPILPGKESLTLAAHSQTN